jgi:hypothetical protein
MWLKLHLLNFRLFRNTLFRPELRTCWRELHKSNVITQEISTASLRVKYNYTTSRARERERGRRWGRSGSARSYTRFWMFPGRYCICRYQSNRPWRPIGLWDVKDPRPVTGIALLYGDGVCFLWGTNWIVSTPTSSQYLAVNCEPIV